MRKRTLLPSLILLLSSAGLPAEILAGECIGPPVAVRTIDTIRAPDGIGGGGVLVPAVTGPPSEPMGLRSLFGLAPALPLVGEPVNGFPNWQERVIHEWINRARVDPQADLAGCGTNCSENIGGCYTPQVPLIWDASAGRSARYHSAEMGLQTAPGYLTIYPADGTQPITTNVNFIAGRTRANNAILELSGDGTGRVNVFNGSGGTVHFILDLKGYFQ